MTLVRTFTANPAVDQTLLVDELRFDEPIRTSARVELAGGKGINAARAIVALGGQARSHGPIAGRTGLWLRDALDDEGLEHRLVSDPRDGWKTRTTTVVASPEHAVLLYDPGEEVPPDALLKAVTTCHQDLERGAWLIVSGSLPRGGHEEAVGQLISGARSHGAAVLVDSSGDGLRAALEQGVDIVKVDRSEAAEVTGQGTPAASARALLDGSDRAVVTAGSEGAIAASRDGGVLRVPAPHVDARHPAGSGDAFAGALVLALAEGASWTDALRSASAAGAANTLSPGAGRLDPDTHARLLDATDPPAPVASDRP